MSAGLGGFQDFFLSWSLHFQIALFFPCMLGLWYLLKILTTWAAQRCRNGFPGEGAVSSLLDAPQI